MLFGDQTLQASKTFAHNRICQVSFFFAKFSIVGVAGVQFPWVWNSHTPYVN